MNQSVINIKGIHADSIDIELEHSTDTSHLLIIRDELGHKVYIRIIRGEITETWKE